MRVLTAAAASTYLPLSGGTLTGQLTATKLAATATGANSLNVAGDSYMTGKLDVNGQFAAYNYLPLFPQVQIAGAQSTNNAQVGITTGYELRKWVSSSRMVKQDITDMDPAIADEFLANAQAVRFFYDPAKVEGAERPFIGFISEDLDAINPMFSRNTGEDRIPDDRAIIAMLTDLVQRLEKRVATLEAAT